jgi:hypothetical protein
MPVRQCSMRKTIARAFLDYLVVNHNGNDPHELASRCITEGIQAAVADKAAGSPIAARVASPTHAAGRLAPAFDRKFEKNGEPKVEIKYEAVASNIVNGAKLSLDLVTDIKIIKEGIIYFLIKENLLLPLDV